MNDQKVEQNSLAAKRHDDCFKQDTEEGMMQQGDPNDSVNISESKATGDALKETVEANSIDEPTTKAPSDNEALIGSVDFVNDALKGIAEASSDKVPTSIAFSEDDALKGYVEILWLRQGHIQFCREQI